VFNIAPKIVETLLADEALAEDFDEVATRCIVALQRNVADLNGFLLSVRGKKPTDKRREVSTQYIANILFYTAILIHLNGLPPDLFDMDSESEDGVIHGTEMYEEAYFHSPLMLGTHMMGIVTDIADYMWSDEFNDDDIEFKAEAKAANSNPLEIPEDLTGAKGFIESLLASTQVEDEGDGYGDVNFLSDMDDEMEPMIHRLLAGVMIMADLCDIDLGVCMYNASQITEI